MVSLGVDPEAVGHDASPIGMLLLFATNYVVLACLEVAAQTNPTLSRAQANETKLAATKSAPGKQLALPLRATLASVQALCREVARLGCCLGAAWLLEYHPPYAHATKAWNRDTFYCWCALLLIYAFTDVRAVKATEVRDQVLNREQTEEWKGWMQFTFLLYHYYSADEVYNVIRVMITCYVWLTGFGNFSFFYVKRDFGLARVLQMVWRLNFLVGLLCLVTGNSYILYYICPLHTFYFFVVYAFMAVASNLNHSQWGIRLKLMVLAGIVFCLWDLPVPWCWFQALFGWWLPSSPVIGATGGTLWEWYFRTSLDHWATFLGMVFAVNYPAMGLWFEKVEGSRNVLRHWLVKGLVALALAGIGWWWTTEVLPLAKPDYNAANPYFAVVPLLVFVYFRNLTPGLRSVYLHPLHNIGKTTLETYLLQHHVWLTSNAKTLVNLVPGYPLINALAASVLFVGLSQELYRLTMSLRGMFLPDHDAPACMRSLLGIGVVIGAYTAVGAVLCGDWNVVGWLNNNSNDGNNESNNDGGRGPFVLLPPPYSVNDVHATDSGGWRTPLVVASIAVGAAYAVLTLLERAIEDSTSAVATSGGKEGDAMQALSDHSANGGSSSMSNNVSPTAAGATAMAMNSAVDGSGVSRSNNDIQSSDGSSSNDGRSSGYNNDKDDDSKNATRALASFDGKMSTDLRPSFLSLFAVWITLLLALRGFSAYVAAHPTRSSDRFLPSVVLSRPMPVYSSPLIEATPPATKMTPASTLAVSGSSNIRQGGPSPFECMTAASNGQWVDLTKKATSPVSPAQEEDGSSMVVGRMVSAPAFAWQWPEDNGCKFGKLPVAAAQAFLAGGHVVIIGDSVARFTYYALARALGDFPGNAHNASAPKHSDIRLQLPQHLGGCRLTFLWAPFASNVTARLQDHLVAASAARRDAHRSYPHHQHPASKWASSSSSSPDSSSSRKTGSENSMSSAEVMGSVPDLVLVGCGLWDALWERNPNAFKAKLASKIGATSRKLKFGRRAQDQQLASKKLQAHAPSASASLSSLHFTESTTRSASPARPEISDGTASSTGPSLPLVLWLNPTRVVDSRLTSPLKQEHMADAIVQRHYTARAVGLFSYPPRQEDNDLGYSSSSRSSRRQSKGSAVDGVIDGYRITAVRELDSIDGVHYVDAVYDVLAQVVMNAARAAADISPYALSAAAMPYAARASGTATSSSSGSSDNGNVQKSTPGRPSRSLGATAREVCELANPWRAALVCLACLVMLACCDNFFGLATLALLLVGGVDLRSQVTWDAAYGPLHRKLGVR